MAKMKTAGKAAVETGKFWGGWAAAAMAFSFVFTLLCGSDKKAEEPKA